MSLKRGILGMSGPEIDDHIGPKAILRLLTVLNLHPAILVMSGFRQYLVLVQKLSLNCISGNQRVVTMGDRRFPRGLNGFFRLHAIVLEFNHFDWRSNFSYNLHVYRFVCFEIANFFSPTSPGGGGRLK
jgi:hypothetical protein